MSFSADQALQVNQLPLTIDIPRDPEEMRQALLLYLKQMANSLNTKEGALYTLQELYDFKQYYTLNNPNVFRNNYRSVFDLTQLNGGNIGGGATVAFPHNINGLLYGTMIYAGCTSATPTYFSVMAPTLVWLDAVNINFTNPLGGTALTSCIAVAEYLKT
jgi:hypothetical protein